MMTYRYLIIALLSAVTASAQPQELPNWEQCLEKTRLHSPELAKARSALQELEYGVASAGSVFLPQISASASASRGQRESGSGSTNSPSWVDTESVSAGISVSQDLFSGGGNAAKRRRAQAQLAIGQAQYRQTLADVELRLRQAFIEVLYAQDLVRLTQQIAERRANNVRLIQLRFDGGRENAGSLARSKAQLSQADYEVREATRSLEYALRNLAAAMGQLDSPKGVAGELNADQPGERDELLQLMRQTPDYAVSVIQVQSAKEGFKVSRSSRFPSMSLSASTGLSGSDDLETGSWSVGLRASVPLFTGNRLSSEMAAAKENVVQSEMDLLNQANTLTAILQQRWNSYVDAVENETVQQELYEAELLRAEISSAKYKQGLLSYEDWDIIESNLINQGKTRLQRRRSSEIEQARWKNTLGFSVWYTEQGE
ncbi:MAG TPA: TolC family protein [Pontiella sp.]